MVQQTAAVETYDPTGNPDHVAYAADYVWDCTCGARSPTLTTRAKQAHRAAHHETYCQHGGTVTLDVVA